MIKAATTMAAPYLRTLIGILFLGAAALKYSMITTTQYGPRGGLDAFAATIVRGGVFPENWAYPIAYGVFGLEIIIGLALLTQLAPKLWAGLTASLLLCMTIYLVFLQARGKTPECGCLGQWDSSIPISIVRNALMSLACLPTFFKPGDTATAHPTASPQNTEPATHR
ncbi:MAG: MauE/DoxX family redox-associated membrane protein [Phycisphaerales bacterium]